MLYGVINNAGYISSIQDEYIAGQGIVELALPEAATTDYGFRYRYLDGAWSDAFSGVADDALMAAYAVIQQAADLVELKAAKMPFIKLEAERQIVATNWKVERATEVDAATGTTTLAGVYTERAAIRTASNSKETALTALSTQAEVVAFDPTDF